MRKISQILAAKKKLDEDIDQKFLRNYLNMMVIRYGQCSSLVTNQVEWMKIKR